MEAEAMKNNAYFSVDKDGQLTFTEQGLMSRDFLGLKPEKTHASRPGKHEFSLVG